MLRAGALGARRIDRVEPNQFLRERHWGPHYCNLAEIGIAYLLPASELGRGAAGRHLAFRQYEAKM